MFSLDASGILGYLYDRSQEVSGGKPDYDINETQHQIAGEANKHRGQAKKEFTCRLLVKHLDHGNITKYQQKGT